MKKYLKEQRYKQVASTIAAYYLFRYFFERPSLKRIFHFHRLGMSHDVQEENGCPGIIRHRKGYIETTVMHPGNMYVTKRWSKCSRSSLKSYIE